MGFAGSDGDEPADEDRTTPARASRKRGRSAIGLALILVIAAGLAVWLWPSSDRSDPYASYRAQADSLFARANYTEAKSLYKQVLDARPNDEYVSGRLQRIKEVQADRESERQFTRHLAAGDSLSARADSLLQAQSADAAVAIYREAEQAYASALEIRPGDAEARTQQQSIRSLLQSMDTGAAPEEAELDRGQLFTLYRTQGDEAFEAGNYAMAERKYQEALEYRPDSVAVRNQLQAVRAQLDQRETEARYAALLQQADSLFADEQYAEAQAQYRQALALVPDDSSAAARVATIDSLVTAREERNETYQYHRGRGDVYFDQGAYRSAIESYRKALDVRPDDRYVLDRISESWSAMEAARRGDDQSAPTSARRDTTSG
jgi:tetratricopeptide (TPR) repeat protein